MFKLLISSQLKHYSFSQFQHRVDALSGIADQLITHDDLFAAGAENGAVYIDQCRGLHIVADAVFRKREKALVRAVELQMLDDTVFRRNDEFLLVALFRIGHDLRCGSDEIRLSDEFRTALRMDQDLRTRVFLAGSVKISLCETKVCRTSAVDELHFLFRKLLADPVAEVTVRYEKDLIVIDVLDDLYRRRRRNGYIAESL